MNIRRTFFVAITGLILMTGINMLNAQTYLVNNNTYIVVSAGSQIHLGGNLINQNNGLINNNGTITLTGNWTNNAVNHVFVNPTSGTVILGGAVQTIGGSGQTWFNNLVAGGTGLKALSVSTRAKGTVSLSDKEINLGNYRLYIDNTNNAAVNRTTGFINTTLGGWLVRSVNSTSAYTFPVGKTSLYRPLDITPGTSAIDTFSVCFYDHSPSVNGFDVNQKNSSICQVNANFYHQISKGAGTLNNTGITMYFDSQVDGTYDRIAHWQVVPQWQNTVTPVINMQPPPTLSSISISGWSSFNPTPFALAKYSADATITPVSPVCFNVAPFNLTAATSGGVWSGQGITNTIAGTFNPSSAGVGTHVIHYSISSPGCASTDSTSITVLAQPGTPVNPAGPASVCAGTVSSLYTTSTVPNALSYTWTLLPPAAGSITGNGLNGTVIWNPVFTGNATISVAAGNSCGISASGSINVSVSSAPNATITPVAPVCINVAPFNLLAATPGGIWSGTGITNTVSGTFTPSSAGVGTHVIQYAVGPSGCASTDTVSITVLALPGTPVAPHGLASICMGTVSSVYTSSATDATSYTWTISPPSAGTISGTGTDGTVLWNPSFTGTAVVSVSAVNNCGTSVPNNITIAVNPFPVADFTYSLLNATVTFTNTSIYGVSYLWNFDDGSNTGVTSPVHTYAANGTYHVMLITTNACGSDTTRDTIQIFAVGIAEALQGNLVIYPNPFENSTLLQYVLTEESSVQISLFDITGRLMTLFTDVPAQAAGNYKVDINEAQIGRVHGVYVLKVIINGKETNRYLVHL
jgi:hypothetical protein